MRRHILAGVELEHPAFAFWAYKETAGILECDALAALWTLEYAAEVRTEWHTDWGVEQRWSGVLLKRYTLEFAGAAGLT